MIRRLFVGSVILVCCGCSAASTNTEVASTKWRMENLEQRFLDFREKAALREAGLSSRIAKLEKQLGLPVPKKDEMLASSTQLTPDVHVFISPTSSNDEKKSATVNNNTLMPENMKLSGEKNKDEDTLNSKTDIPAPSVSQDKASTQTDLKKSAGSASSHKPVVKGVSPVEQKTTGSSSVKNATKSAVTHASNKQSTVSSASPKKAVVIRTKKTGSTSMYKHGLQLLWKGRHVEARERLEEFLTEFPYDPLVPNAVYWVGESFYSQKDYIIAVDLFREVLRRFPDSNKASAAMLKIGYSYERLGQMSEARRSLLKVVEKYPKSNEARLARKKLSGI
ncbi:tol-pal system protein YbgF [Halodesulfovibrio marinisediminis]|uniref:Tol-pal system protein YbgF n=1 Tax=Halodesulfovibrio marinisediminis DSM 17456 TaxID=1121457 RepID=A0A1N6I6L1_9BACT|nr:tol-pal system protein YbgF [Halodesulfovibrio marinisediminis]SIO27678.1 tol-pal system protein YbgF [Halodesulfovibrio marinisediminis DSM 17456]